MDPSETTPPRARRKLRWPVFLALALCLVIGGRFYAGRSASHASEVAAEAFTRDLFSGDARRAWSETSRRFQARNDTSKFQAEFLSDQRRPVEVRFGDRRVRDGRATFHGIATVDGQPTEISLLLIQEGGAWKVDNFHIGMHVDL